MSSTQDYIDSLKRDRDTLANNINSKGVPATSSETFTSLASKVLNISGGTTPTEPSNIYRVTSLDEMNSLTNVPDGAICVVTDNSITDATADSQFQVVTLPKQVVFDEPFTEFADVRYRAVDESVMLDIMGNLDSNMFMMDGFGDIGGQPVEIRIEYSSDDGITYNRMSPAEDTIDFGTPIYCERSEMWNDAIGKFLQVMTVNFSGVFEFKDSKWSFLNIGTTATADNIWSPSTFYTSDGMQTSSLNKLSYLKQNVYIQSTEPTEKTGLWLTLLSKGVESYDYTSTVRPRIQFVNTVNSEATLNNNENILTSSTLPFSLNFCSYNSGGVFFGQVYDAQVLSPSSSSKLLLDGTTYNIRGLIIFSDRLYSIITDSSEAKFIKYTYSDNTVSYITLPSWLTYSRLSDNNLQMTYNSQDILIGNTLSASAKFITKFTIETETFTQLNIENLPAWTLILSFNIDRTQSAICYKDYLLYVSSDVLKAYNLITGESTTISDNVRSVTYQGFFMDSTPIILVRCYYNSAYTVYELNLETLTIASSSLSQLPICNPILAPNASTSIYKYCNNKLFMWDSHDPVILYVYDMDENHNFLSPKIIRFVQFDRYFEVPFFTVDYFNSEFNIKVFGGVTDTQSTPSNAMFNFTLSQLNESLINIPSNLSTAVLSTHNIDLYQNSTPLTVFILQDFYYDNITSITDSLITPIKDAFIFHYNDFGEDYYLNDVKDIYIGDGENWNLLKSHTKES